MANLAAFLVISAVNYNNLQQSPGRTTRQLSQLVEEGRQPGFIVIAGNDDAKIGHDPFHLTGQGDLPAPAELAAPGDAPGSGI